MTRVAHARQTTRYVTAMLAVASVAWAAPARGQAGPAGRPPEVHEAAISDLQAAMARGEVTAVQLVDAYVARIRAYDGQGPALNAMIRLNPRARAEAAALDAERRARGPRGPLHGVPVILKDNFDTADLPTSGGSVALASAVPPDDAFVVKKLRAAGAVILGKANMHELAAGITTISSLGGQTRNAYDPRRCPGGSSGGTGVAIAASFAAVGWGTDTCGSIRIPAAYGSLFGLRPTQGLVSRSGIIPLSRSQDIAGPLARTVTDLAIALDATVGPDPADTVTRRLGDRAMPRFATALDPRALQGARLGVLTNYFADTDGDVARVIRTAIDAMQARGADVVDVTIPDLDSLMAGSRAVDMETKFDLLDYLARNRAAPVRSLSEILAQGLYHVSLDGRFRRVDTVSVRESEAHRAALAKQRVIRDRLAHLLDSLRLDALVYPTMRQEPALIGDQQSGSTCTLSANSGLPAITAPAGFTRAGLPVGIELLGRPFADARLVALAYAFEQTGPRRRPPLATPPLVNGRAPAPAAFTVTALPTSAASAVRATASFLIDLSRYELRYDVRVSGVPAEDLSGVALQRADSAGAGPVVHRLTGPGTLTVSGTVPLTGGEVAALREGRYLLTVFTADQPAGAARARVEAPR
ncbi:MAG TPA: amidase family protein [Gemmatimonadales bacterium]|nr:amidase family protein [Gemmatimonadales bacterium]